MSVLHAINQWLAIDGSFSDGVRLLKEYGCTDEVLLLVLSFGETSVSRRDLRQALKAIRDEAAKEAAVAAMSNAERPAVTKADIAKEREELHRSVSLDAYNNSKLNEQQRALLQEAKDALREMNYYRSRLEVLPDSTDRYNACANIIALDLVAVRKFHRLDTWVATGRDPGEARIQPKLTQVEMYRELRNLESYISRAKSGKRPTTPERLKRWERRRDELQKALANADQTR